MEDNIPTEEELDEFTCAEGGNLHSWVYVRHNAQHDVSLYRCVVCGEEVVE